MISGYITVTLRFRARSFPSQRAAGVHPLLGSNIDSEA
jgi:hypothetical protein